MATAATFLNTLSVGMVCCGSIEMGIGGEFFDGEIYGPVLAEAYRLESKVAKYPRILIGDQVYDFIDRGTRLVGSDVMSKHTRSLAESCKNLISTDPDGKRILDYLGPEAREVLPFLAKLLHRAIDFVSKELERFQAEKDEKLEVRYKQFYDYLTKRRKEVWSDLE